MPTYYKMRSFLFAFSLCVLFGSTAKADPFPSGRCYVYDCYSSPWDISWTSSNTSNIAGAETNACFTVNRKPGICFDASRYDCCTTLGSNLHKIVLASSANCQGSVVKVTVNGTVKSGGVFFELGDDIGNTDDTAELILTTLRLYANIADGTTICLHLKKPCASIDDFCIEHKSGLCKFSMYDAAMKCCPTCFMLNKKTII
jgi:hypothetical protein